jgi:hypothetical protein
MLSKIPMERFGQVDEITSLICWIAGSVRAGRADLPGGNGTKPAHDLVLEIAGLAYQDLSLS